MGSSLFRLLYRIIKRELNCLKFGLPTPQWIDSIRFVSLVINTWDSDARKLQERSKDPIVMDIGWREFIWTGLNGERTMVGHPVHLRVLENISYGNRGIKRSVS